MSRKASTPVVLLLALASVLSLVAQQQLVDAAARMQRATAFPFPVVDPQFGPPVSFHVLLVVVGFVQAAILFGLWKALRERELGSVARGGIVAAALAMAAVGLLAATVTSFDPYAYLGYAKLSSVQAAYAPPAVRFPGAFAAINDVWGSPMVASYYGPLWVAFDRLVAGNATSFSTGIFALRLVNVGALAVLIVALAARRAGAAPIALVALNPSIYAMYVANAHNDLTAIALVVAGLAIVATLPLAAALCVAAAALVKLPLVALSLVVFAGRERFVQRSAWVGLTVALVGAASWFLGGAPYVHDLLFRLHQVGAAATGPRAVIVQATKLGLTAIAAIASIAAFCRGGARRGASWSFVSLGPLAYPWYLAWCIPYAALDRVALVQLLIALPFAAALMDVSFAPLGLGQLALLAMLVYGAYDLVRALRRPAVAAM